jgi:hypothetical protein
MPRTWRAGGRGCRPVSAALSRGTPANLSPYLERMSLGKPQTRQEWLWQRLLERELRTMI